MKLVKSLLLGSATALVAVSGASAADLGVKKPAAVEYVKVCNTYGAGFFYLPGSNTCVKIGGRARFEAQYTQQKHGSNGVGGNGAAQKSGYRALGQINLDARTATEYGTLRTFVRLQMANRTGSFVSGSGNRLGLAVPGTGADFVGKSQQYIDFVAFVQFAGLTAGRVGSFYDFYTGDINWYGTGNSGSVVSQSGAINLIAYTATFGSGFSATLSAEDAIGRRQQITQGINMLGFPASGSAYGGSQLPDLIANVRVDQAWGSAQLAGALHQVNTVNLQTTAGGSVPTSLSAKYGYGIQGGLKINLPMLAAGDEFWLQASYAKGATMFGVGPNFNGQGSNGSGTIDGYNASKLVDGTAYGPTALSLTPAIKLATSYGIFAGILHYWTPTVRQGLFGAYGVVDQGSAPLSALTASRFTQWQVGSNVIWSPVKGLDIGLEVQYNRNTNNLPVAAINLNNRRDADQWVGRVRVQRDF